MVQVNVTLSYLQFNVEFLYSRASDFDSTTSPDRHKIRPQGLLFSAKNTSHRVSICRGRNTASTWSVVTNVLMFYKYSMWVHADSIRNLHCNFVYYEVQPL